jgi:arylsulfatase A
VRSGRWKLAIAPQQEGMGQGKATLGASLEEPRLYDLEDDLGETTDVADDHPTVVARLRGLAERMREELCGDRAPGRRPPGTVEKPAFLYPVVPEPVAGGQPRRPD